MQEEQERCACSSDSSPSLLLRGVAVWLTSARLHLPCVRCCCACVCHSGDDNAFEHAAPADDSFGLSSPPAAATSSEEVDPFATVDGGSQENAGAFDSFSNQPAEVKEEEQAALQSDTIQRASRHIAW